jgi:hypothetical protein
MIKTFSARLTLGLVICLLTCAGCATNKTSRAGSTKIRNLAQQMIGTWVMVGVPGQVRSAPEKGGRFKYRTGTHWTVFSVNESGLVTENFGGSYTMEGDEYIETQEYADYRWKGDNGKSFIFQVKIEGDLMTQLGVGNGYNEVWKRVK